MKTFWYFGGKVLLCTHFNLSHFIRLIIICNKTQKSQWNEMKCWNYVWIYFQPVALVSSPQAFFIQQVTKLDSCVFSVLHWVSYKCSDQKRNHRRKEKYSKIWIMHKLDTLSERSRSDYIIFIAFCLELASSLEIDIKPNNFFSYSLYITSRYVPFLKTQPQYHLTSNKSNNNFLSYVFNFPYLSQKCYFTVLPVLGQLLYVSW